MSKVIGKRLRIYMDGRLLRLDPWHRAQEITGINPITRGWTTDQERRARLILFLLKLNVIE